MARVLVFFFCCSFLTFFARSENSAYLSYIETYSHLAISEMGRTGIPASIKLAQAILESNAGQSELARKANNHFGIKCGSSWTGKTVYRKDDDRDRFGNLKKSCFRSYKEVIDSYIAHSEFLMNENKSNRYGFLFELKSDDYKGWAKGLKKAGYATNPKYDKLLIKIIEDYDLARFDREKVVSRHKKATKNRKLNKTVSAKEKEKGNVGMKASTELIYINGVKVVKVLENESPLKVSLDYKTSLKRLEGYNPGISDKNSIESGTYIYLQSKRKTYRGKQKFHKVKEGEDIAKISDKFGLREDIIRRRNHLDLNDEPRIGEKIYLKGIHPGQVRLRQIQISEPTQQSPNNTKNIAASEEKRDKSNSAASRYYKVEAGDTLYSISRKFEIDLAELLKLNDLVNNQIHPGQILRLN